MPAPPANALLTSTTSDAAIEITGLTKSFGAVPAVGGIDLSIAPGEVVALLGPNGAGKSTTIDLLLGLLQPDGGQALLFGDRRPTPSPPDRLAPCCRRAA